MAGRDHDGDAGVLKGEEELARWMHAVASRPEQAALFFDIDGTIAPIAPTPGAAIVPGQTREVLGRLIARCGLVGFVSGRALDDGRRLAGLEGAAFVGNHGLEIVRADGSELRDGRAERFVPLIAEVKEKARAAGIERLGVLLEDKRSVLAAHYRSAENRDAAAAEIERLIVSPARELGLKIYRGRLAVEVRPPLEVSKGDAAQLLLGDGDYATAAFFGDDVTDLDGFRALDAWARGAADRLGLTLAVVNDETPAEVREGARVWVSGTVGVTSVVTRLLERLGG